MFTVALMVYTVGGELLLDAWSDVDYWEHLAAISAFAQHPLHPADPYVLGSQGSHLLTPYHLLWGLVVAVTHTSAYAIAPLMAAVNMALFLVGLRLMAVRLVGSAAYAVPLGLSMLLLWLAPHSWSGFHNLGLLPLTAVYPYWFALPLSMIALAVFSPVTPIRPWKFALEVAVVAFVFLVHPLTGSFLALALAVSALTEPTLPVAARLTRVAPAAAGLALSLAWPFFPVLGAIAAAPTYAEHAFAGDWRGFYDWFPVRLLPASLGLLYFAAAWRRRSADWLSWTLLACLALYLVNGVAPRSPFLGRYFIYVTLLLQWGVLRWLREALDVSPARHAGTVALFLAVVACTGALEGHSSLAWIRFPWSDVRYAPAGDRGNREVVRRFQRYAPLVSSKDVVMADMQESWILPAVLGCRVVGVMHGNPFMRDYRARRLAVQRFFDPGVDAAERDRILARYSVSRVVVQHSAASRLSGLDDRTALEFRDDYYEVRVVERNPPSRGASAR